MIVTIAGLAIATLCPAQDVQSLKSLFGRGAPPYRARTPLITGESQPTRTFPYDGVWTVESYNRRTDRFFGRKFRTVGWNSKYRYYSGLRGTAGHHILALTKRRLLVEQRRAFGETNELLIMDKKSDGFVLMYLPSRAKNSDFTRALQRAGLQTKKNAILADRKRILRLLRSHEFSKQDLWSRWRRPTHEEMKRVWSLQQLGAWQQRQRNRLVQTTVRIDKITDLGELSIGRKFMGDIASSGVDRMGHLCLDEFGFGPSTTSLKRLAESAKKHLLRINEKIDTRMKSLSRRIKTEIVVEGRGRHPRPGDAVRFHYVMTAKMGRRIGDSRARGRPTKTAITNKMPEGLAFALCSLKPKGKGRFEIPADLAYGDKRGDITFEVELLGYERVPQDKPPIKETYFGNKPAPLNMTETASKLLYTDMRLGKGATPTRGQRVVIKVGVWSATGRQLEKATTKTIELGSPDYPQGLNEGLATMRPGGVRMLCLPRHLGYQTESRRGMALRMMVSLLRIEQ